VPNWEVHGICDCISESELFSIMNTRSLVAPADAACVVGLDGVGVPVDPGEWWVGDGKSVDATLELCAPPQPASTNPSTTASTGARPSVMRGTVPAKTKTAGRIDRPSQCSVRDDQPTRRRASHSASVGFKVITNDAGCAEAPAPRDGGG
jgi:hypothetical protein